MMKRIFLLSSLFFMSFASIGYAEKIIWSGDVSADGKPTNAIRLTLRQEYQIRVSGFANLGKWIQNKEKLANDACFEFNKEGSTAKIATFRNSSDISVCDGKYHDNHVYQSEPFKAEQNKIHFWLYDTNYEDNTGALKVQIVQLSDN